MTCIMQPGSQDSKHLLSLYQVRFQKDWAKAKELLDSGEIWQGEVTDYNRGGLIVNFGRLEAFVPSSQLFRWRSGYKARLEEYVGQKLSLQVVFVDQDQDQLVFSERYAIQQIRRQNMERLLNELVEGETRRGTVRHLCGFGAFVDLGGADGLIHNSELAWQRVRHPDEILQVGDEIDVYILHLDHKRKRIGLSLKRLQPNPWDIVQETYTVDQLVKGLVTNVVDFGAFVALDIGAEGLVHISELADPQPQSPREVVQPGDELVLRILSIDPSRQRIGLSLKRVSAPEHNNEWLAQQVP
jgi:small subunit ribosomal protein S1